ncbi:unnamed protein product [Lampetra planeri]
MESATLSTQPHRGRFLANQPAARKRPAEGRGAGSCTGGLINTDRAIVRPRRRARCQPTAVSSDYGRRRQRAVVSTRRQDIETQIPRILRSPAHKLTYLLSTHSSH